MRKFSPLIAAVTGAAILTLVGYVQAFSGHGGHHHGSPALAVCLAAAPQSVKTNLWSIVQKLFIAQRPRSRPDGKAEPGAGYPC